jgi:SAM-dependent methyltransferase
MITEKDPRLQSSAIRERYNDLTKFSSIDPWHRFTAAAIRREVHKAVDSFPPHFCQRLLNAGAGGNDLGLNSLGTINLDISEMRIMHMPNAVVATVEMLPLANNSMDAIVCVGSVINYCDAAAVITEFSRVLRPQGYLLLDFDSSYSAEFIGHEVYKRTVGIVETFYASERETLWLYSPRFICSLLSAAHVPVVRSVAIHVLSPWVLLLSRNLALAATVARLDFVARHVPFLPRFSSNRFFVCQKRT